MFVFLSQKDEICHLDLYIVKLKKNIKRKKKGKENNRDQS